jgi:ketosteroid isomerase-like protein
MADAAPDLVELTRQSMGKSNEGDFDAAVSVFAEDAAFDVSEAGLGRFEGRDAVRGYLEDWTGSYERQEFTSWRGTDMGGGVVFVVSAFEGQPVGTTARVQESWAFTVRWEDGAIAEVVASQDLERARAEAARLAASRRPSDGGVAA